MSQIIVDSNIVIYSMSANPDYAFLPHELVKYQPTASAVTKVEVLGFSRLTLAEKSRFENFFKHITLFDTTPAIIEQATILRQHKKMSLGDAIIAGTALAYGLPLMTRNVADFDWIDSLEILNPFNKS